MCQHHGGGGVATAAAAPPGEPELITPEVALARWLDAWGGAGLDDSRTVERVPLLTAVGRVLAHGVRSLVASPAHDLAAMDGIAVTAADIRAASVSTTLDPAGYDVVDTGDPLPPGRDAVVPHEQVLAAPGGRVVVSGPVAPGRHVRLTGEDVHAGQKLMPGGHRLRPVDVAILATTGYADVPVRRRPRVAVIPTGDEIRPPGTRPALGEIVDSNSVMIAATVQQEGALAEILPIVPDDPTQLEAAVRAAAADADLVMLLAGTSAGRGDHAAAVIGATGRVLFHGLPLRPGHPVVLGVVGPTPVIGVPGYPVAADRVTTLFALPALRWITGASARRPEVRTAVLGAHLRSPAGVDEQALVRLRTCEALVDETTDPVLAEPLPRGAGALNSLVLADGVVRLPIGCTELQPGDTVAVEPTEGSPRWDVEGQAPCATR